jgi:HPt (histidine-containing phosphotransfer) domain-containing protein
MSDSNHNNPPRDKNARPDAAMIEQMQLFVDELPQKVVDLHILLAEHDAESIARLAHRIREAAGEFGFAGITQAAAEVESSAEVHADLESLSKQVQTLAEMCNRARTATPKHA